MGFDEIYTNNICISNNQAVYRFEYSGTDMDRLVKLFLKLDANKIYTPGAKLIMKANNQDWDLEKLQVIILL